MMKKLAALGLTAALVFAPVVAFAEDTPAAPAGDAATPAAGDTMAKPMKHHRMKHHAKHSSMKHHGGMHHPMKKAGNANPPGEGAPAAEQSGK